MGASSLRSGELIDRLLNPELSKDDLTALAPMTAVSRRLTQRERESVDMVFMGAMRKVYGGALRPWAPMIRKYVAAGACPWLRLREVDPNAPVVSNGLTFDREGGVYILTDPNSGGKSVFTCGVGILQIMLRLGIAIYEIILDAFPNPAHFFGISFSAKNQFLQYNKGDERYGYRCNNF